MHVIIRRQHEHDCFMRGRFAGLPGYPQARPGQASAGPGLGRSSGELPKSADYQ